MLRKSLVRLGGLLAAGLGLLGLLAAPAAQAAPAPVRIGNLPLTAFVTANDANENLFMQSGADLPSPRYQLWTPQIDEKTGEGTIVNSATGGCLAVYRIVIGDRRPVVQRPCDGERTQVWTIKQDDDGTALFINAYTNQCMGFEEIFIGRDPQLLEFPCEWVSNQTFRLVP